MKKIRSRGIAVSVLVLLGCGAEPEGERAPVSPFERLQRLDRELSTGSTGDDVVALNEYLGQLGYFPNDERARVNPNWQPIVPEAPADSAVFDEATSEAVYKLQLNSGLEPSGLVDEATRAMLALPRCGNPDGDPGSETHLRFSPTWGSRWPASTIFWRLVNADTADVTFAQARSAVIGALAQWSGTTNITFVETTGTPNIDISFDNVCPPGFRACVPVQAPAAGAGGDVHMALSVVWSVASPTPPGASDLQADLTHEIGHALSLNHSSFNGALLLPSGNGTRSLSIDDQFAISTLYDKLVQLPLQASDIAASSGDLQTWMVGNLVTSNGFQIYQWAGDSWALASGNRGALRIAVAAGGIPWIVDSAGNIYRRTTATSFSGTWTLMPGLAKDIGAGSDGSVWVVGTDAIPGGFGIHKWNGTGWDGTHQQGGVRIAVDSTGVPWIISASGDVYRRTWNTPFTGFWQQLPKPGSGASDIAIHSRMQSVTAGSRAGGYAWVASGKEVLAWNEQDAITGGNPAPGHFEWKSVFTMPIGVLGIGVNSSGNPWIALNRSVYTTTR